MKPISHWKHARYRLEVATVSVLRWGVPLFPRRLIDAVGRVVGWFGYYFSPAARRIALANLDIAFGDTKSGREKSAIVRASFQNFVATFLLLFWTRRLDPATAGKLVEVEAAGLEQVRQIQARGQGIIFVTLHFGNWELLSHVSGHLGIPLTIVMEQMRNAALREVLAGLRAQSGHRVIPQRAATVKLLKAVKRGGNVAMLMDLNGIPGYGGVWVDFFGLPVYNHATAAALALHSRAPIVGGVAYPLGGGRVRIVYGPEIKYTLTGDRVADLQTISQQCLAYCERVIREHPEHWLWSYKRWKYRPDAETGRYPFYSRVLRVRNRRSAS